MKSLQHLIAYAAIFCASLAHGQSVDSLYNDPTYGKWGHPIRPQSFTFEGDVTYAGATILRSVLIHPVATAGNNWFPPTNLGGLIQYINASVVDSFDVGFPATHAFWDIEITYTTGQNGWTKVIHISNVPSRQFPTLQIGDNNNGLYRIGYTLYVPVLATNYASGQANYDSKVVLEYESAPGVWTYYDEYEQNGAIGDLDGEEFEVELLGPPAMPAPLVCLRLTLYIRHYHQGGYSDIVWTKIAQTNGINCFEWEGLSTGVDGPNGPEPCCLKINPNLIEDGVLRVSGFVPDQPLRIFSLNGQFVRLLAQMPVGDLMTVDVSDLAAGEYLLQQVPEDESKWALACKFVKR